MNEVERKLDELLAGLHPEGDSHLRKALIAWFYAGVRAKEEEMKAKLEVAMEALKICAMTSSHEELEGRLQNIAWRALDKINGVSDEKSK